MCGTICPKATHLRMLDADRIFDYSWGERAGLCHVTIRRWAVKLLNCVQSNPEESAESGYLSPLSSGVWGAAGAILAANVRALANCVLKPRASSPDCCASWVIARRSSRSCSSVPADTGLVPASPRLVPTCPSGYLFRYNCAEAASTGVPAGPTLVSVMWWSRLEERTPSAQRSRVRCTVLPSSAPLVLFPLLSASP